MKKVVFIGNRLNALRPLMERDNLNVLVIYVLEGSFLHNNLIRLAVPKRTRVKVFGLKDKESVLKEIESTDFDFLVSNGCPFILPVSQMKKPHQLFINVHPTLLPDLKGKTPLNGVFMTHRRYIGATMHYIDDGIDTGRIIAQEKVRVTNDLDQGLVYIISFELEATVFKRGMKLLFENDFQLRGKTQNKAGSYFNRTPGLQTIDIVNDTTNLIIDKVRSFGVKSQGSFLQLPKGFYTVYTAEQITNEYLSNKYTDCAPGDIILSYDDKVIVKTVDGLIKLTSFRVTENE